MNHNWLITAVLAFTSCYGQIPPGCEVTTTTGYRYSNFHHLHSNPSGDMELNFRVMAKSDAHIALTTSPLVLNPLYEIVIGASGNNYTDLRRTMTGRSVSAVKTPSLLSENEFRGFWVAVRQGEIEVGREGQKLPYFHWKDPDPLPIHYYSLSSWTNTVSKWIHKCDFIKGGPNSELMGNSSVDNMGSVLNTQIAGDAYYNLEEKLKANLLLTYNKDIRPSAYHNQSVTLTFGITLLHLELSEITSRISLNCWFRLLWRDDRLQWNATAYENISVVHIPSHNLWQPDLTLYNNANAEDMMHFGDASNVLVYPDGSIIYLPPVTFESLCSLDLRYWPYDTQVCYLKFGSWTHDGSKMDLNLQNNDTEMDTSGYFENLHWELINTTANVTVNYYECCPEPYPSLHYSLTIRRKSLLLRGTIVAPGIVIAVLTMIAFILPPNATGKLLIGLLDLLILCFFLAYFSIILPSLDHVPTIVSFYSNTMVLVGLSVILAVVTIALTQTPILHGPPYIIKSLLVGLPGKLLGLGQLIPLVNKVEGSSDEVVQRSSEYSLQVDDVQLVSPQEGQHDKKLSLSTTRSTIKGLNQNELEWLLLAYALDRIAFLIYLISFIIMMFSFM